MLAGIVQVGNLPVEASLLPQQEDLPPSFLCGLLGALPDSAIGGPAQVVLALGRSIHRQPSSEEQLLLPHRLHVAISAHGHFGSGNGAALECRALTPVL